ncbi:hypothetical protein GCWU000341_01117 [Oribacterium sp. oral taxon 078 str. F0262]|nr:hypothetical protein GCWU000341_01117 [Oribacterium sp. oral taxon 078 str. F0262]
MEKAAGRKSGRATFYALSAEFESHRRSESILLKIVIFVIISCSPRIFRGDFGCFRIMESG